MRNACVRLPPDGSPNEALHATAWLDLLSHDRPCLAQPGEAGPAAPVDYLLEFCSIAVRHAAAGPAASVPADRPADESRSAHRMRDGTRMSPTGGCGSDLFVRCESCAGDRVVIEVKGPDAKINRGRTGGEFKPVTQLEEYRDAYEGGSGGCRCGGRDGRPLLVLLDARSRSTQAIEHDATDRLGGPDLSDWTIVGYSDVLTRGPYPGHPLARWLLLPGSTRPRRRRTR